MPRASAGSSSRLRSRFQRTGGASDSLSAYRRAARQSSGRKKVGSSTLGSARKTRVNQGVRVQRRPPRSFDNDHAGAGRRRVPGRLRRGNGEIGVSERLARRRQAHTRGLQPFSPARSVAENRRPLDRAWQEEPCVDAGERPAQRRTSSYSSSYWRAIACALKLASARARAASPSAAARAGVVEQRAHGSRERDRIVRRHEQAGLAVGNRLRDAADVGGHDRAAREHRLDERERKTFVAAREDVHVEDGEVDPALRDAPGEDRSVGHAELQRELLERVPLWSVSDEHGSHAWQVHQRAQEDVEPLLGREPADRADHGPRHGTVDGRCVDVGHAVVDRPHGARREPEHPLDHACRLVPDRDVRRQSSHHQPAETSLQRVLGRHRRVLDGDHSGAAASPARRRCRTGRRRGCAG